MVRFRSWSGDICCYLRGTDFKSTTLPITKVADRVSLLQFSCQTAYVFKQASVGELGSDSSSLYFLPRGAEGPHQGKKLPGQSATSFVATPIEGNCYVHVQS